MFGAEWLASEHVRIVEQTLEEGVEGLLSAVLVEHQSDDRSLVTFFPVQIPEVYKERIGVFGAIGVDLAKKNMRPLAVSFTSETWMRIEGTDRAEGIVITSSDYLGSRVCFCARITRVRSNIIKVGEFERLEPLVDNLTSEVFKGFNEWQKANSN